jgi:predicted O-methyltransferase YrrM
MKNFKIQNDYIRKLNNFMMSEIQNIQNIQILEFGVRKGISTKMFLEICKNNNGKLYSVDVEDFSGILNDDNWTFIHSRDDNYDKIEKIIPEKLDIIYLDSYHEPNHVEKIIYHYYPKIKDNGFYVIDDICWLPYVKNNYRDNFGNEVANIETFQRILEIHYQNKDNFDLEFSFIGSGLAKITKKNSNTINKSKKIPDRSRSFKNFIKKLIKK